MIILDTSMNIIVKKKELDGHYAFFILSFFLKIREEILHLYNITKINTTNLWL